jgi:uncharacterized protein YegP (UPF0339 family)
MEVGLKVPQLDKSVDLIGVCFDGSGRPQRPRGRTSTSAFLRMLSTVVFPTARFGYLPTGLASLVASDDLISKPLVIRVRLGPGRVIARSEAYERKSSALNGIESVRTNAPIAEIDDQTDN